MSLTIPRAGGSTATSAEGDGFIVTSPGTPIEARFTSTRLTEPTIAGQAEVRAAHRSATVVRDPVGYALIQRVLDVVLAGAFLLLAAPLLGLIVLAIKLDSDGPVFYRAGRIGRGGERIQVVKFRTMRPDSDVILALLLADSDLGDEFRRTFKLRQDPRCTRVGRFLRRSSLDELPQFWNVLRGEMALVGPRPVVEAELDLYRSVAGGEDCYLAAKPGVTGFWQISGRSNTTYRRRVLLDRYYVTNRSTAFDLWILIKTPIAVIKGDGAY